MINCASTLNSSHSNGSRAHAAKKGWRDWGVFLEPADRGGRHHAYICAYKMRQEGLAPTRFGVRLDLPGTYITRGDARRDAVDLVRRHFKGEVARPPAEVEVRIKEYVIRGTTRFRADIHQWEPWLEITRGIGIKKIGQRFKELDSPFYNNTFASAEAAAHFAAWYGERMVLGAIPGLRI